jgi:hypothetical protein
MGGGLMQLVAYGAQDIYLTGNPQITFFKVVYRRHTNFSMEAIEQTPNGTVGADKKVSYTISRNGDLVGRCYLEHVAGAIASTDNNYGHQIIDYVSLEIGGQQIDKHYGHWMEVWSELTEKNDNGAFTATATMAGATPFQRMACAGGVAGANGVTLAHPIYVPLQFWFCRNPGLALPLIALQYHEVKIQLKFSGVLNGSDVKLYCDYIYLDTDERRRFAQVSHEYLIEQVQFTDSADSTSHDLNLNHPVKELIWTGGWLGGVTSAISDATTNNINLKLNGHDRMAKRPTSYFTRAQVWQHHNGHGACNTADSIAVYSFALEPEEHQPSGTCNFSRIDNAQLKLDKKSPLYIYAVNYNVLRIMSGMGGLAYSN